MLESIAMKKSIYKVPDGKLLKIFLEEKDGIVESVKITGDFFMHPEEKIGDLENALKGVEIEEAVLTEKLQAAIDSESIELFGADAASIAHAILIAK